jgi:hypothetical protein
VQAICIFSDSSNSASNSLSGYATMPWLIFVAYRHDAGAKGRDSKACFQSGTTTALFRCVGTSPTGEECNV